MSPHRTKKSIKKTGSPPLAREPRPQGRNKKDKSLVAANQLRNAEPDIDTLIHNEGGRRSIRLTRCLKRKTLRNALSRQERLRTAAPAF